MKISLLKVLVFNIAVLLSFSSFAQNYPDYVITVKGDSIPCKIIKPLIGGLKYKSYKISESITIDPAEIKEYHLGNKNTLYQAVFKDNDDNPIFMSVVERGKINLYESVHIIHGSYVTTTFNGNFPTTTNNNDNYSTLDWYISKGSNRVTYLKGSDLLSLGTRKHKDIFGEILKDNKIVYGKFISNDKFSFKQIRNLVHLYNTGKPFSQEDYVVTKKKDTVFCEIELATLNSPARYRAKPEDKFKKIDTAISQYFFSEDSLTYTLKTLPGDKRPKFFKQIIKGRINLYSYSENPTSDSEASLFVSKETGDLIQIKHSYSHPGKNEKKAFGDLIIDNTDVFKKFESVPLDFTSILDCVKIYNTK